MPRPRRYSRPLDYATLVRRRPSLDFSITGLIYCSLMMFMGLAAINSQANLLFGVFGLMIGILLVSVVVSRSVLKKVALNRLLPESAVVGLPTFITYELHNEKHWAPSLSITVAELDGVQAFMKQPQAYMLHAAPHMTAIVPAEVIPKRRGLHELDRYQISTSFPFGFIKRATELRRHESILIYPTIGQVDPKLLQLMRSAESTGATMRPRRGGMDEFYGLKEYRHGENPRYIYWRRSARTGTIVAKEMTHVSPPKIILLVDTYIPPTARSSARHGDVERGIAMAASLANHALEAQLSVGLIAWSSDGWVKMPPNRGKRHRRDILTILARLPLNESHDAGELIGQAVELQESSTSCVLFTPGEGGAMSSGRSSGSFVVIPADSPQSRKWFQFHPNIDFEHCMPEDQEPGTEEESKIPKSESKR
jgi:uncharacterized protein (DUF58 family)